MERRMVKKSYRFNEYQKKRKTEKENQILKNLPTLTNKEVY